MPVEKIARYEIVQEIGKGAMGVVYKAVDPNIGRTLALKTMRLDVHGMEAEEMLKRFRNEARAAGLLSHPNIVTIYDAGDFEGLFYIAMEFLEGISLHQRMRQGRLTTEEIVDITSQICAGLDYAHAKGVIHRDVKPANIMMAGPLAKIMDFGIAKAGNATMTGTGQVLGTPNYMAPEQVRGKHLDGRSDLFSLGVILYELVTGERPFTGENVTTIVYKIVHENPIAPRELDVTIHPGLSEVVLRALEKTPDLRFQSGAELAKALQSYKSHGADTTGPTAVLDAQIQQAVATGVLPPSALSGSMTAAPGTTGSSSARTPAPMAALNSAAAAPATAPEVQPTVHTPPPVEQAAGTPQAAPSPHRPAPLPKPKLKGGKPTSPISLLAAAGLLLVLAASGYWKLHQRPAPPAPVVQQQAAQQQPAPAPASTQASQPTEPPAGQPAAASAAPAGEEAAATPSSDETKPAEEAASGDLRVNTKPEGGLISLDNRHDIKWIAPYTFSRLKPGAHKVTVEMEGFKTETRSVDVAAGKRASSSFELAATKGYLQVTSDPAGAIIVLDGQPTGQVTPNKLTLDPGQHHVGVHLDGYRPETALVDVGAGQTLNLSPKLNKIPPPPPPSAPGTKAAERTPAGAEPPFDAPQQAGANPFGKVKRLFTGVPDGRGMIEIRTKPKSADVWVNRFQVPAQTPLRLPIKPGTYTVTVRKPGYKAFSKAVEVKEGAVVPVDAQLEKQ